MPLTCMCSSGQAPGCNETNIEKDVDLLKLTHLDALLNDHKG